MGRKKKKYRPIIFCYYCDREFENEKVLIQHQRAKHFKCTICYKRLGSARGMMIHVYQVHKQQIDKVPHAREGRDSFNLEIFGMSGVPPDVIEQKHDERGDGPPPKYQRLDEDELEPDPGVAAVAAAMNPLSALGVNSLMNPLLLGGLTGMPRSLMMPGGGVTSMMSQIGQPQLMQSPMFNNGFSPFGHNPFFNQQQQLQQQQQQQQQLQMQMQMHMQMQMQPPPQPPQPIGPHMPMPMNMNNINMGMHHPNSISMPQQPSLSGSIYYPSAIPQSSLLISNSNNNNNNNNTNDNNDIIMQDNSQLQHHHHQQQQQQHEEQPQLQLGHDIQSNTQAQTQGLVEGDDDDNDEDGKEKHKKNILIYDDEDISMEEKRFQDVKYYYYNNNVEIKQEDIKEEKKE